MRGRLSYLLGVVILSFLLGGCAGPADSLQIRDAWVRSAASGATTGAFALIVNSTGETDRLVGVECAAARAAEIHETRMEGDIMQMRPVDSIEIPAGGQAELKPGSYHIMLIDLQRALQPGEKLPITLIFEKAGRVEVEAEVKGM
jgi:hypothetical protein